jgi:type I restriction-modification system DNA methylase subunit
MAKKAAPEQNITNKFKKVFDNWDKLVYNQELDQRYIEQETLEGKTGNNRPDIVGDFVDGFKLVAEIKRTNSTREFNKAKKQLLEYVTYYEDQDVKCLGVVGLYNPNTNKPEWHIYQKVGDNLVEDSNEKNLDGIDWLNDVYDKIKYQNSDKEEDYKPLIEKEIKTQVKQLHEMIRNGGNIKAELKVYILNACVFACGFKDFRDKVAGYADDGTFSSKVAAKINFEVMESSPSVTRSIKYSLNSMETNSSALNAKNVKYKEFITNSKYHTPGESKMSIVKAICCFITSEIFEKIEKTYKNATLDISSILYHEFIKYTRGDGKDNGIVLTAEHISRLMARLAISSPQDHVLDVCTGTGSLLLACRDRKKELIQTEEDERYVNDGYMGIEFQNDMFFLAYTNLHFNKMAIDYIHVNDCHAVEQQEYDDFGATCGILNPPYSMAKKNENAETHAEWAFVLRALKNIKKGGRLAVIIPVSCGCDNSAINNSFKKRIMENNTLEKIIKVNHLAFSTASTHTQIFIFTAGVPHEPKHKVQVVDYTEDGYNMQSEKFRIVGDTKMLEERVIDVCENNKAIRGISHFETFTSEDEWVYLPEIDEMYTLDEYLELILDDENGNN